MDIGMTTETTFAFGFGAVFVTVLLVLAVAFPHPSKFQYNVFRIVLSLASAGVAATIPGFLNIDFNPTSEVLIRAGGAIAIFIIVYFFSPVQIAITADGFKYLWPVVRNKQTLTAKLRALSSRQFSLLEAVEESNGLTVSELGKRTRLGPSELTHRCYELENEELIVSKSFHVSLSKHVTDILAKSKSSSLQSLIEGEQG